MTKSKAVKKATELINKQFGSGAFYNEFIDSVADLILKVEKETLKECLKIANKIQEETHCVDCWIKDLSAKFREELK